MIKEPTIDFDRRRPVERCVLRLAAAGLTDQEIGLRLRRSPRQIARIRALAVIVRPIPDLPALRSELRPIERCVLRLTGEGESDELIGTRLGRSRRFVLLARAMARYKQRRSVAASDGYSTHDRA